MEFLPLFFQLHDKPCLIVGGGVVAQRKAILLVKAGARIAVVAQSVCASLEELVLSNGGSVRQGDYVTSDLAGKLLVIAATDDDSLNQRVFEDAQRRQIAVNVVDNPELCSFIFPAIVDRSPIMVAVSSGGRAPVLVRLLRAKIESFIPSAYGKLAKLVGAFREHVKQRFHNTQQRKNFWEQVLQGPIAEAVLAGDDDGAERMLREQLMQSSPSSFQGEVYLVGAGPGDPDLLTFKALRLIQKADVVLYDRLVAEPIVDLARRDAERIYVGKSRSNHSVPQQDINQLLVTLAKQGKRVLRLKGGDPFIFGRGGEEIEQLAQHNIPFQVVPGITAASGCAAYAGIPLTHRDYAQSVRFVTGHLKNDSTDLPWEELVHKQQTVVFYMGLVGLPQICRQLIAHGRSKDTPIALIQQGTTKKQRVIISTLADMPEEITKTQVKAPTLIIVGEVVTLSNKLRWFSSKVQ